MRSTIVVLAGSALIVGAPLTFERHSIIVGTDGPQIYAVQKTWWGFKETQRELKWMQAPGYDYEAWCTRDGHGRWYPYLIEREEV